MRDADIKAKGRRKEVLVPEEQHSGWGGCTAVVRGQRMVRSPQAKPGKMGDNRGAGRRLDGGGGGVLPFPFWGTYVGHHSTALEDTLCFLIRPRVNSTILFVCTES